MNILLITDDQHRCDAFSDLGVFPDLRTPRLDRLRAEGTTVENWYSNCPICMPARFTWMTGLYASQGASRLTANCHDWPLDQPTFAQALQHGGYHTALIGKVHRHAGLYPRNIVADEPGTRGLGFDDVFEVSGKGLCQWFDCRYVEHLAKHGLLEHYREHAQGAITRNAAGEPESPVTWEHRMDTLVGNEALRWIETYDGSQPFFTHISFCNPHPPLDTAHDGPLDFSRHQAAQMPDPVGDHDASSLAKWREQRALYCGLVEEVDYWVGQVLDAIEARGWLDETLVIFGTDHGHMLGDLGWDSKGQPYETSCRTPFTFRLPGCISGGQQSRVLAEAVDLPVTILEAVGMGADAQTPPLPSSPGRSVWPHLLGRDPAHRQHVFAECGLPDNGWQMVRDARFKYVHRSNAPDELYDLGRDPDERSNLADSTEHREMRCELQQRLIESLSWMRRPNSDDGAAVLKSLSYLSQSEYGRTRMAEFPTP